MRTLGGVNLAVKFGLELVAIAAFSVWGASLGGTAIAVPSAVILPLVAIGLWGRFAAPRSSHRLPANVRVPFELTVFALAALALLAAGHRTVAIVFAATAVLNAALLTWLQQWDR